MKKPWKNVLKYAGAIGFQIGVVVIVLVTGYTAYNLGVSHGGGSSISPNAASTTKEKQASKQTTKHTAHPADLNSDGEYYTCSMHPQIQQDEPGDCPICGMELVVRKVKIVGADSQSAQSHDGHDHKELPVGYACSMNCVPPMEEPGDCPICGMDMLPVYDNASSNSGNPARQMVMSPEAKALAKIQTAVVKKRPVVRNVRMVGSLAVDPSRRAHISADVGGRVDKLHAEFEGVVVEKGQDLALFYSPELLAVQQEFLQASRSLKRLSGNTLESVQGASESAVAAARERLRLAGLTRAQIKDLENRGTAEERVILKAPIGGTVIDRHVEEGEYVEKGGRILAIADLTKLWVELEAYESDLPWLRKDQKTVFSTKSLPGEEFPGEIAFIDPVLNQQTRTVRVRANVGNPQGHLRPGMYVTGIVEAKVDGPELLVIPASAPLITGKRAVVYVEVSGADAPTFEGREIVLGGRSGDSYIVYDGLREGDRIVTNGAFQIDSALQIIAKPSMMNPRKRREIWRSSRQS